MMALTSLSAVAVPVVLGRLVHEMAAGVNRQAGAQELLSSAATLLGLIAALVVLRELFNVVRRFLVENTCTRIDKHLSTKLIARLLKVELATLTHQKIGALNSRLSRPADTHL